MTQNAKDTDHQHPPFFTPSAEPFDAARADRLAALGEACIANGYAVVEVVGKQPKRKSWNQPNHRIEAGQMRQMLSQTFLANAPADAPWAWQGDNGERRGKRYPTGFGVLVRDLVAVDLDVNDRAFIEKFADRVVEKVLSVERMNRLLVRSGGGAKELWLAALVGEPFVRKHSGDFFDRKTGESHQLEVFGGGLGVGGTTTRQVVCAGDYPGGPEKGTYAWLDDIGPHNTPVDQLEKLTTAEVEQIIAIFDELAAEFGWVRLDRDFKDQNGKPTVIFCLDAEQELRTVSGPTSLHELTPDRDRVRMYEILQPLGIDDGQTHFDRGVVRDHPRFGLSVWDSKDHTWYCLKSAVPDSRSAEDVFVSLAAKLRAKMGDDRFEMEVAGGAKAYAAMQAEEEERRLLSDPSTWAVDIGVTGESWADMAKMVRNLQRRYAHFAKGRTDEQIVCLFTGEGYRKAHLKDDLLSHAMVLPTGETYLTGDKAGEEKTKLVNPLDQWLADPNTIKICGYQFDPGNPARLLRSKVQNEWLLNIYEPPTFTDLPGEAAEEWFETFLEYLVPGVQERDWLRNWIAYKVQHPGERGAVALLVTHKQGTGRNLLIKMLRGVLGSQWVSDVNSSVLLGGSGQSQFDDGLINKLLITCDEVLPSDGPDGLGFRKKLAAYERLKQVFDPFPQARTLSRKGLSPISTSVHYSALLASNHASDALPLDSQDRRVAVIACTRVAFKTPEGVVQRPDIKAIVDRVLPVGQLPDSRAIKGLWEYLSTFKASEEAFYLAPDTEAKRLMVEDNEGEVEETFRRFVSTLPEEQDVFWFEDMVRRCEGWLEHDRKMDVRGGFKRNVKKLLRNGFAGWCYPNAVLNYVDGSGTKQTVKLVVRREGELTSSLRDRGRWLEGGPKGEGTTDRAARLAA